MSASAKRWRLPEVFPSYAHQERERDFRFEAARAQFWCPRSGKSKPIVDLAGHLYLGLEIEAVIVVAPNQVHFNWIHKEFATHAFYPFVGLAWSSEERHSADFRDRLRELLTTRRGLSVLAMNNKAFGEQEETRKACQWLAENKRTLFVVDEAHHFRDPESNRSRRARFLGRLCPWRRLLTGTATADHPRGFWAMMDILEPGAMGFLKYQDFLAYYFHEMKIARSMPDGRSFVYPTYKLREDRKDELRARWARYASVIVREDCPDLPRVLRTTRYYELEPIQRRVYESLRKDSGLELQQRWGLLIDPVNAAKRLVKAQQCLSGWLYEDDKTVRDTVGRKNPKMELLEEVLQEERGAKHVVWCHFVEDIERVRQRLVSQGCPAVVLHGGVSGPQKREAIEAFQRRPDVKVLVGQPASGGEGQDFSAARRMVWFSHTWKVVHRDQAKERCTEMYGDDVEMIDLVGRNSCEERMLRVLDEKTDIGDYLTGGGLRDLLALSNTYRPEEETLLWNL